MNSCGRRQDRYDHDRIQNCRSCQSDRSSRGSGRHPMGTGDRRRLCRFYSRSEPMCHRIHDASGSTTNAVNRVDSPTLWRSSRPEGRSCRLCDARWLCYVRCSTVLGIPVGRHTSISLCYSRFCFAKPECPVRLRRYMPPASVRGPTPVHTRVHYIRDF